ncbi:uncharacterized protein LOC131681067 [Topomyia yanbarensis]|uniref:uncharacterized protein LOC131681067 n=1 Tax=Topomyia yanbarensis TaxID=2498891 RepID=UPI00273BA5C9|nr:uncharacterized protein LOC131681067 [Topomyia yanbarensis]
MPVGHSPPIPLVNPEDENVIPPLPSPTRSESESFRGFQDSEIAADAATTKELTGLFRQRNQVHRKLVRLHSTFRGVRHFELAQLNVMSSKLVNAYAEFNSIQNHIMALVPDEKVAEQERACDAFEDLHDYLSTAIEGIIIQMKNDAILPPTAPQVVIQQQPLKAPIPTFDGMYANWPKFKAVFQDLMANSADTDAIKLYHLDKALVGAAAGVLDENIISAGNYQQAWAVLTERYENQRVIVESHIRGLLQLKRMSGESYKDLRALLDESTRHVESLRYLNQQLIGISEHMIVYTITNALDKATRKAWESTLKRGELPKYESTIAFLKTRCQILENCETSTPVAPTPVPKSKFVTVVPKAPIQKSYATTTVNTNQAEMCELCGGAHFNYQCATLKNLNASQMSEKIRAAGACFNCLRKGHRSNRCPSNNSCRKCQKRHHTILHDDSAEGCSQDGRTKVPTQQVPESANVATPVPVLNSSTAPKEDPPVSTACSCNYGQSSKIVLLLTAIVHAIDRHNQPHECRVLLDSGSQVTGTIPSVKIDVTEWNIPQGIHLADPEFHKPEKIDMLVGAELFFDLLKPGCLTLADNLPQLRDTHLGWVVVGVINDAIVSNVAIQQSNVASIARVERLMHQFWSVEEVPDVTPLSVEEQSCETHFLSTHNRNPNGRFVVSLPLKENVNHIDDCRALALKRFLMPEKRLQRDAELRSQYVDFIREYEALGHCHEVKESNDQSNRAMYYMPHHAVLRPHSSSTKCRVVFDASAKSSSPKLSLNEVLKVGPIVQRDLFSIMLSFRKHAVAFSADITKMYRQILVAPEDTCYQRIFWREQPTQPLRVLELDTVTYGTASAPYQATRCLLQLAEDESADFPIGARIVKEDCYIDDVLSGADTIEEAIECHRQLKQMLARGCFPVHKWCSNSDAFMQCVPVEEREKQFTLQEYGANEAIRVLGLLWDPNNDQLLIAHQNQQLSTPAQPATKRIIYSEIARFFDPLGLFSPVIVVAKILMQQLWKTNAGWDDILNEQFQQQWRLLQESLPHLNFIQVPRCVTFPNAVAYELHGFADASAVAYGACIYVRSISADGSAQLKLLSSKSKVAPLHEVTIPKKELCAALLLTRLLEKVLQAIQMRFREIVLWSDSTIVLAWLKKPADRLQVFVRNRVAEIQRTTGNFKWCYVRSGSNPADVVSRGQLPEQLLKNELWWNGPVLLRSTYYELEDPEEVPDQLLPEMKLVIATPAVKVELFPFVTKFSNFRKVQRIMAYVLRFVNNCQQKHFLDRILTPYLTIRELQRSTEVLIKISQHVQLADEIERHQSNKNCKRVGNLRPFIQDGLLRVGGRLIHSKLPYASKHPIILPDKDPITTMLIRTMHIELLHPGQSALINAIRQRYWPLKARSIVRQITRKCVQCFRVRPGATTQLMGNLPQSRIVPSPPFAVTGVDYAGPLLVKQGTYRPKLVKAYVAVYVCMTTKAVHLEAVSDLTTDAFLASLRRFISRRGLVQQLHSDNATNFKGANHELNQLYHLFRDQQMLDQVQQFCAAREIEWHFIPPDAPEFGGLWEAAVKSAKTHLKRVVGNARLTFEELATILTEIEAVLNSRPLFSISTDPADPQVITPAHYLIGRPLITPAEPSLEDIKANRLSRWQHLQLMREHFWRAWRRDYLNTLQPRKKNLRMMPNLRPGMVVLLHDKTQPPLNWKLGHITAVHPDAEGLLRVVDIFVDGSTFRRPVNKLSVLPIEDNSIASPSDDESVVT